MRTLQLNLPETVDFDDKDVLLVIASHLFEKGKLSLGQAAQMVGLSKESFLEIVGSYVVSVFNYSVNDLDKDLSNAKDYNR